MKCSAITIISAALSLLATTSLPAHAADFDANGFLIAKNILAMPPPS